MFVLKRSRTAISGAGSMPTYAQFLVSIHASSRAVSAPAATPISQTLRGWTAARMGSINGQKTSRLPICAVGGCVNTGQSPRADHGAQLAQAPTNEDCVHEPPMGSARRARGRHRYSEGSLRGRWSPFPSEAVRNRRKGFHRNPLSGRLAVQRADDGVSMKILVTAGPTHEPLDPVRYLGNRSSGKMGYAIAQAALDAGHDVLLVSGPVALVAPTGAETVRVTTSDEMYEVVHSRVAWADVCVLCAAVADFRPVKVETRKIKKNGRSSFTLELVPTRDILRSLSDLPRADDDPRPVVVGFAAETNDLVAHAREKLRAKGCALIVANDVSRAGVGFESDENELTLLFASGEIRVLERASKNILAASLVKIFSDFFQIVVDDQ